MTSESEPLDLLTAWTEALLAEREHDRKHLAQIFSESSLKVRRSEGLTWSPVEVTKASYAFGGAKWSVACKEGGGLPGIFRVGSAVLLTPVGDVHDVTEWGKWPARVMKIRGLEMDVVLEGDGPEGRMALIQMELCGGLLRVPGLTRGDAVQTAGNLDETQIGGPDGGRH